MNITGKIESGSHQTFSIVVEDPMTPRYEIMLDGLSDRADKHMASALYDLMDNHETVTLHGYRHGVWFVPTAIL